MAIKGENALMPTIVRKSNKPYKWTIGKAQLSRMANKEKMMPKNFISNDGFHITQKCRDYLLPLIKGECPPPYRNGMPNYVVLKNKPVKKILNTGFKL